MNNSNDESIRLNRQTDAISDELLGELEDSMVRLARLISSRHVAGESACEDWINPSQMMLLRAIETHGELKMAEVAALLAIKPPAASAMVDGLERQGYVHRAVSAEDRRVTHVGITEAGQSALEHTERIRREHMRRFLSLLAPEDIRNMIRIQQTLIDAIDAGEI